MFHKRKISLFQFWNDSVNDHIIFIFERNIHLQYNTQVHSQAKSKKKKKIIQVLNSKTIDTLFKIKTMYTILPKVLGHPLLMKGLTTLVISMSTNLNV